MTAPPPLRADAHGYLLRQLDTAWKLARFHLDGLTTDECLWRPALRGLHVTRREDGQWSADWPEREGYDIGPPSIAWVTWHMVFWWSMVLDHSFGPGTLERGSVAWPGSADSVRRVLDRLHCQWRAAIAGLSEPEFRSPAQARWPYRDRPFGDVVAWANVELVKNASEIGYARFRYAGREPAAAP
jgi:DinB superfamily